MLHAEYRHMVNEAATPIEVACVPILDDNYVWLLHDSVSGETVAVDPGEAEPVLAAAAERGWRIGQIWITHWHGDHTNGIAGVKQASGATVAGPAAEAAKIDGLDRLVEEDDTLTIGRHEARVIATPGHTAGHISLHLADAALLFPGDTLFAMGCGRLFEGTAADMFASFAKLAALPDQTAVYPAHEYTLGNARFARTVEPDNAAIADRLAEIERLRAEGDATLPTTIGRERETNPFMRAADAEAFGQARAAKDAFKG